MLGYLENPRKSMIKLTQTRKEFSKVARDKSHNGGENFMCNSIRENQIVQDKLC